MRLCVVFLLVSTGCLADDYAAPALPTVYLADSPPLRIQASPGRLLIDFSYTVNDDGCRQLSPAFTARINGEPIPISRGDVSDIGIDSPDWFCTPPGTWLSTTHETAELELADETMTRTFDLANAFVGRSATLSNQGVWTRGMTYDVAWSSALDVLSGRPDRATIGIPNATYPSDYVEAGVSRTGDVLHVTVPATLSYAGRAEITFTWGELEMPYSNTRVVMNGSITRAITIE